MAPAKDRGQRECWSVMVEHFGLAGSSARLNCASQTGSSEMAGKKHATKQEARTDTDSDEEGMSHLSLECR